MSSGALLEVGVSWEQKLSAARQEQDKRESTQAQLRRGEAAEELRRRTPTSAATGMKREFEEAVDYFLKRMPRSAGSVDRGKRRHRPGRGTSTSGTGTSISPITKDSLGLTSIPLGLFELTVWALTPISTRPSAHRR